MTFDLFPFTVESYLSAFGKTHTHLKIYIVLFNRFWVLIRTQKERPVRRRGKEKEEEGKDKEK